MLLTTSSTSIKKVYWNIFHEYQTSVPRTREKIIEKFPFRERVKLSHSFFSFFLICCSVPVSRQLYELKTVPLGLNGLKRLLLEQIAAEFIFCLFLLEIVCAKEKN